VAFWASSQFNFNNLDSSLTTKVKSLIVELGNNLMAEFTTQTPQPSSPPTHSATLNYFLAFVALVAGVVLGFLLAKTLPGTQTSQPKTQETTTSEITIPGDAVQIQACADKNGALFVKPADIPTGPVYMVHDGKVIGLKFMLPKDEFLAGKPFEALRGLNIRANHINVGFNAHGHEGYKVPHYHVDVFSVGKSVTDSIVCEKSAEEMMATPSGETEPRFNP